MDKYIKKITIDIDKKNYNSIPSVQYDNGVRYLHINLINEGKPIVLKGCSVKIGGIKPDGFDIFNSCKIIDEENGLVEVNLTEQINAADGTVRCELKIYNATGVLTTKEFNIEVSKSVTRASNITSSNEFTALTEALAKAQSIDDKADKKQVEELSSQLETLTNHCTGGNGMQEHSHVNKTTLDKLGESSKGKLTYNGSEIDFEIKAGTLERYHLSETELSDIQDNYFETNLTSSNNMTWLDLTLNLGNNPPTTLLVDVEEVITYVSNGLSSNCAIWFDFKDGRGYFKTSGASLELNKTIKQSITLSNPNNSKVLNVLLMVGNSESKQVTFDRVHIYVNGELNNDFIYPNTVLKYEKYSPRRIVTLPTMKEALLDDGISKESMEEKVNYKDFVTIENATWFKGAKNGWSGGYHNFLTYQINKEDLSLNNGDKVTLKAKIFCKENLDDITGFRVWHNKTGAPEYSNAFERINEYTKEITLNATISAVQDTYYAMIFAPMVNSNVKDDIECYIYDISITKVSDGSSLIIYPNNAETSIIKHNQKFNPMGVRVTDVPITSNDLEDSYVPSIKEKIIMCGGDSLTNGYNGATNSYVDYVRDFYNKCTVLNKGSNGGSASRLVNMFTDMARDGDGTTYPIGNPDYTNVIAVIFNIGTNGGVTGNMETSIPQLIQKTVQDIPFEYEGKTIDTVQKYWDLFKNDWWGNMGLLIEYIKWKNPRTQIFLTPPLPNNIAESNSSNPYKIREAMYKLAELYGIQVIDTINGLGINKRNNHLFRLDYCHGNNLRNEMVGKYIAKQIYPHIYDF